MTDEQKRCPICATDISEPLRFDQVGCDGCHKEFEEIALDTAQRLYARRLRRRDFAEVADESIAAGRRFALQWLELKYSGERRMAAAKETT